VNMSLGRGSGALTGETDEIEARAETPEDLVAVLCSHAAGTGCHKSLDEDHSVTMIRRGGTLLVTFEAVEETLASPDGLPFGLDFVEAKGWSLLHFSAARPTWFRAPAVYRYLDTLAEDPAFQAHDRVIFFGAGMGGYAACAYSVVSPGATVVAVRPQATLDAGVAPWESRYRQARRHSFTDRYGYAPDMLDGAMRAFVVYDPVESLDAMHAALFRAASVTLLRCPHLGPATEKTLREMDVLHALVERAADGRLDRREWARLLDARRRHPGYLRRLEQALEGAGHDRLAARLCRWAQASGHAGFFRKRAEALAERHEAAGRTQPAE